MKNSQIVSAVKSEEETIRLKVNQEIIKPNVAIATYSSGESNNPEVPFLPFL